MLSLMLYNAPRKPVAPFKRSRGKWAAFARVAVLSLARRLDGLDNGIVFTLLARGSPANHALRADITGQRFRLRNDTSAR